MSRAESTEGPGRVEDADAEAEKAAAGVTGVWLAAGAIALVVMLVVLGLLAAAVQGPEVDALDRYVSPLVHDFASPPLDALMFGASVVGSGTVLVPLAILAVAGLLFGRHVREAFFVAAAAFGSILLNDAIKLLIHRPRPKLPWSTVLPDYSFPSGHSMNSLALFVALAIVVWVLYGRRAGIAALVAALALALAIGLSRIYLGFHYLTDVVGGYLAAAMWLLIVAAALDTGSRVLAWRSRRGAAVERRPPPDRPRSSRPADTIH